MEMNNDIFFEWDLSTEVAEAAQLDETVVDEFKLELNHYDEKEQEDQLWMARTGLNPDTLCGTIETLVFMSDRPISIQKIKAQIDNELPLRVVHEAIARLQAEYETKHHGIRLAEVAEGFQFRTKATYAKFVQNLFKFNALVLTPTALEVLAIIAYKQPVSRVEVDKIRGVDSSHIIRALMDKRLVKMVGRSEELGRPTLFGTTEEFLEVFNLADISQLPPEYELEEMATKNTIGTIADIKSVVFRGENRAKFSADEMDELESLSQSINQIASDTNFTMLLKSEEKKRIDGEATVKKSAFDILEEFVNKEASLRQNMEASHSTTIMNVVEAKIADLALEGVVFNAPEVDFEFEEMRAQQLAELDAEQAASEVSSIKDEMTEEWNEMSLVDEAEELSAALDAAFESLTGEKLTDEPLEFNVEAELEGLDFSIDEAVMKGKDFGLDLSFLNDDNNIDKVDLNGDELN